MTILSGKNEERISLRHDVVDAEAATNSETAAADANPNVNDDNDQDNDHDHNDNDNDDTNRRRNLFYQEETKEYNHKDQRNKMLQKTNNDMFQDNASNTSTSTGTSIHEMDDETDEMVGIMNNNNNNNNNNFYDKELIHLKKRIKHWNKVITTVGVIILVSSTFLIVLYFTTHLFDSYKNPFWSSSYPGDTSENENQTINKHDIDDDDFKLCSNQEYLNQISMNYDVKRFIACFDLCQEHACCLSSADVDVNVNGSNQDVSTSISTSISITSSTSCQNNNNATFYCQRESIQKCPVILQIYTEQFKTYIDTICYPQDPYDNKSNSKKMDMISNNNNNNNDVWREEDEDTVLSECKSQCSFVECCFTINQFENEDITSSGSGSSSSGSSIIKKNSNCFMEKTLLCEVFSGCMVNYENAAMFGFGIGPVISDVGGGV